MAYRQPTFSMAALLAAAIAAGCASPTIREPSPAHLGGRTRPPAEGQPPPLVLHPLMPPPPRQVGRQETYSVTVNNVPVHDLLFALARDAEINVDIHPGIDGRVTLNAVDQTLPQLLERISRQVSMRFEMGRSGVVVMPDIPFLRSYAVDYPNIDRETTGSVAVTTQLAGAVAASGSSPLVASAMAGNNSTTRIENRSRHRFWETLVRDVGDILRETDKILPDGSSETVVEQAATQRTTGTGVVPDGKTKRNGKAAQPSLADSPTPARLQNSGTTVVRRSTFREAASVIAHPESGVLTVRATAIQHQRIQEFLDRVLESARRQVMIEATLVEVQLSNTYRQGIDWSRIAGGTGFGMSLSGPVAAAAGLFSLSYDNGSFGGLVRLLDRFGTTKVLSSPKLSVLNNQTAVLKVVDNSVYFTVKADTSQNQTTTVTTYTTTLNQVPVGFVMNVTPQISDTGTVLLNVRPSVSRIIGTVRDPNPALRKSAANTFADDIISEIPVIRTREMESMLRVRDGAVAVMGGLMEDSLQNRDSTVPGLGQIPALGEAFTQRDDTAAKTELVIFLRPTIIRDPSLSGDYAALDRYLPGAGFFTDIPDPKRPGDKVGQVKEQ